MRKTVIVILMLQAFIQAACGGQHGKRPGAGDRISTDSVILISERENAAMRVVADYVEGKTPVDQLYISCRYIGHDFLKGNNLSIERSGVRSASGNTGMVINTRDLKRRGLYKPVTGGGPHIWISKQFSRNPRPWANKNGELVLQMYAAVPAVQLTDSTGNTASAGFTADQAPVTQLSFGVYLKDRRSKKVFAYIICVYESRGTFTESAKNNDTFTNFTSTPLESTSRYITKSPASASLQSHPFADRRFFKVHITGQNLLKAIKDTDDGMSADLSDYVVTMAGVLFELPNYVASGSNTSSVNISKLQAFILK